MWSSVRIDSWPPSLSIYVNYLCMVSFLVTSTMLADDTNVFLPDQNFGKLFNSMQNELKKIPTWFTANKLSLNTSRTKHLMFHFQNKVWDSSTPSSISNQRYFRTKSKNFKIPRNFSWQQFFMETPKNIDIIFRSRDYMNKNLSKQPNLYFIDSYINYAPLPLDETHLVVVRGFIHREVSTKCVNKESSTERHSDNRQAQQIFSTVMSRPESILIRQE